MLSSAVTRVRDRSMMRFLKSGKLRQPDVPAAPAPEPARQPDFAPAYEAQPEAAYPAPARSEAPRRRERAASELRDGTGD